MQKIPFSRKELHEYLEKISFSPAKKFGQNFLLDENIHKAIVESAELCQEDAVLEIGPGLGHLTTHIIGKAGIYWGIEIDRRLHSLLKERFSSLPGVQILSMDILSSKHEINPEVWKAIEEVILNRPYKIVANLPYNISAPVISNFLEAIPQPSLLVVTVQKEVAKRLVAKADTSDYGPLSIHTQLYSDVKEIRNIPPNCFYPAPKVDSTVVMLRPHPLRSDITNKDFLFSLIQSAFSMRRKTLYNCLRNSTSLNLSTESIHQSLEKSKISPERRGETLSIEECIVLANAFQER